MIWLFSLAVVVVVVVAVFALERPVWPKDEATYRARVGLYAIRRRLEVAQFKTEVRRDGAQLRRQLRDELDGRKRGTT
jgi:cytochrome c-type biogenesis protein CcmH/NrfG